MTEYLKCLKQHIQSANTNNSYVITLFLFCFFSSSSSFQGQFSRNQNFIIMIIRIFMLITITSRVVFHNFRLYSFPCLGFTWYLELHPILAVCRSVLFFFLVSHFSFHVSLSCFSSRKLLFLLLCCYTRRGWRVIILN